MSFRYRLRFDRSSVHPKPLARRSLAATAVAACVAAMCAPAGAQTTAATYLVTSVVQTADGRSQVRETLSLETAGQRARLRVAGADGSLLVVPVALGANGQITSASQDGGVTCYNMAMGVLAHAGTADDPAGVFMQFSSSVVPVPLLLRATEERGADRTIVLDGTSTGVLHGTSDARNAGLLVRATIGEEAGTLRDATFDEISYIDSPATPISRATCTLQRAQPAAAVTRT